MKLDEGDIRIYYKTKGGSNFDLDDFFRLLLKLMGYQFYASGMDMEIGVRDLCFEKREVRQDA